MGATLPTLNLNDGAATGTGAQGGPGVSHVQRARREQGATVDSGHTYAEQGKGRTAGNRAETEEQGNAAELTLAALLRLGANTPDTWIAREVGCSRKTVARWKKRFQEQGLLSASEKRGQPPFILQASETVEQESKEGVDQITLSPDDARSAQAFDEV